MARQEVHRSKAGERHVNMVLATDAPPLDTSKLRYDYAKVAEAHRQQVMEVAVDIRLRERRAAADMVSIGQQLLVVKDMLPHGDFETWIETEFELGLRMAQEFMRVAERFSDKDELNSLLTATTMRMLAAPSVPDAVIEAVVVATEEAGHPLKVREVKAIRDAYRPPPPPTPPPAKVVYLEPKPTEKDETKDPTPPDLAEAGYTISQWMSTGKWVWGKSTGINSRFFSMPHRKIEDAIQGARHDLWLHTPKTLPDPRVAQAQSLRRLLNLTREAVNLEYGPLTGKFTDIPPLERAIDPMIANLDSLLATLTGNGDADA